MLYEVITTFPTGGVQKGNTFDSLNIFQAVPRQQKAFPLKKPSQHSRKGAIVPRRQQRSHF